MVMRVDWIADADALAQCIEAWRQYREVGFDTEFIRVRTFYPNIALYQVGAGEHCALIDPLAVEAFDAMRAWLSDPATVLVMHSCSEDLEVMQHHLGVLPATIFDTQLAASFVGRDHSLGYQALVRRELSVELRKGETRSDWLRRPLSPEQQRYAAEDVHYLPLVFERLQEKLVRSGRNEWAWQEMRRLRDAAAPRRAPDYYLTARDAWRLDARQLGVFRALCLWREETARRRNRPRGHVVGDDVLLEIARRGVTRRRDLAALLPPAEAERSAVDLAQLIEQALDIAVADLPALLPGPLTAQQGELLKSLKACIVTLAAQLDMAETTLASRRFLEAFVRGLDGRRADEAVHDDAAAHSDFAPASAQQTATVRADTSRTNGAGSWREEVVIPELQNVVAHWRRRGRP